MRRFAATFLCMVILFLVISTVAAQTPPPAPSATPFPSFTPTPNPIDVCFEKSPIACLPGVAHGLGAWGVVIVLGVFLLIFLVLTPLGKELQSRIQEWFKSHIFRATPLPSNIIRDYLKQVETTYSRFKFRGLPTHVGENSANRLSLDQVYVSLRMLTQGGEPAQFVEKGDRTVQGRMSKSKSVSLPQALKELKKRRLAIIGIAGSGKSTLLQWAGLTCVRALSGKKLSEEQKELIDIFGGRAPFPILVPCGLITNTAGRIMLLARSNRCSISCLPILNKTRLIAFLRPIFSEHSYTKTAS